MTALPVREMVLYKHGVGFFVREGAVEGENVALTFRQDEINDVLKSLAVFDKAGGQVLGIHYQTPMDIQARLASSSIRLSDSASLRDLLTGLRGRQVKLEVVGQVEKTEFFTGRMLGIDDFTQEQEYMRSRERRVSLVVDGRGVVTFNWLAVRSVQILDAQADHDLTYFLDTSMSEDARRTVNVRLSSGAHDLSVYYVAPSPTWRVSYRLVAEADESGQSGKALLQGWGLFDNRLEEDLDNVQVTLVAGQPISFIYDLYASRIPARPTVQDEARVAPGPVEYGISEELEDVPIRGMAMMKRTTTQMAAAAPSVFGAARPMERASLAQSTPPAAQAQEAGEFFQYVVTAPVSVKRGESALVPIIGSDVKYERELLYNGTKLPTHPVVALRFANSTGLTLERGPVTVVEDGDYKGEAVIPFTKDGGQVYVPFAVELGVRVTELPRREIQTTGLKIEKAILVYEQYEIVTTVYKIENTTAKSVTVTIETTLGFGAEFYDTPPPDIENGNERRWRVSLPTRSRAEFSAHKRSRIFRREEVLKLDYLKLQTIIENRWLDDAIRGELAQMLDEAARVQQAQKKQKELSEERTKFYSQQEQLRANLGALQATGQEAALRNRMLGQLEASQNRLEAIENEVNELTRQIAEAEQKINDIIANLG